MHCTKYGRRYGTAGFCASGKGYHAAAGFPTVARNSLFPTLVLVGDGDELTPPGLSKEICADIAGARLVVVPGCGHLSTLEKPDAVNAALAEWLST